MCAESLKEKCCSGRLSKLNLVEVIFLCDLVICSKMEIYGGDVHSAISRRYSLAVFDVPGTVLDNGDTVVKSKPGLCPVSF